MSKIKNRSFIVMEINNLEKFKNTIASGKTALGAVVSLSDMAVSECAGDCGLDFIWIDAEHSPHTLDTIKGHVTACRGTGCAPFVRVSANDPGVLKPVLDLAPAGVIIPMVNSAEEAESAVSASCAVPCVTGQRIFLNTSKFLILNLWSLSRSNMWMPSEIWMRS